MKILIPRDACPRSTAACFVSESGGSNSIPPRAFSGSATTASLRGEGLARACVHLDAAVLLRHRGDRGLEPRLERRPRGDRFQEAPRPGGEGDAAARELGQREAPARERMPAEDADGAGLVEPAVGDGLELGREDVALLVVQVELVEPLGDRLVVEAREPVGAEQRVVGLRQRLLDAVDEQVPAALGDGVPLGDRPGAALVPDEPARDVGVLADLDPEAGAGDLRPDVGLVPVHPAAAELDVLVVPPARPGAPAEPVAGLEEERLGPAERGLASRSDAGKPAPDDDDVVHGAPSLSVVWSNRSPGGTPRTSCETLGVRARGALFGKPDRSTVEGLQQIEHRAVLVFEQSHCQRR